MRGSPPRPQRQTTGALECGGSAGVVLRQGNQPGRRGGYISGHNSTALVQYTHKHVHVHVQCHTQSCTCTCTL